jgi:hypothetical protein
MAEKNVNREEALYLLDASMTPLLCTDFSGGIP